MGALTRCSDFSARLLPAEEEKPVFGEIVAYLHRHNRVTVIGALVAVFAAGFGLIGHHR